MDHNRPTIETVRPSLIRSKKMELDQGNAESLRSPYLVKKLRGYEIFRSPCYCMGKLTV
jgi:hypothetical protein